MGHPGLQHSLQLQPQAIGKFRRQIARSEPARYNIAEWKKWPNLLNFELWKLGFEDLTVAVKNDPWESDICPGKWPR